MIISPSTYGIAPSDLIIKSGIEAAIADIQGNSFLLDYVLQWLLNDDLTTNAYGKSEFDRAKKWLLNTNINVSMNYRTDDVRYPQIAIVLQSSVEQSPTLGDVNYDVQEKIPITDITINPQPIVGPFTPVSFVSSTGIVTLPSSVTTSGIFKNQILLDQTTNTGYPITDVYDATNQIVIAPNVTANFSNAVIAPIENFYIVTLEGIWMKQTFALKIFAENDAIYALYLEQLLLFILLRYKQQLFEGRGFENMTVSSGPLYFAERNKGQPNPDVLWARDVTITGMVRHYWPKLISQEVQGIGLQVKIIGGTATPANLLTQQELAGWIMSADPIGTII